MMRGLFCLSDSEAVFTDCHAEGLVCHVFLFFKLMGQKKPHAKRRHTPVWQVLWSVRPHLLDTVGIGRKQPKKPLVAKTKTPPLEEVKSAIYDVVETGRKTVVITMQLLHLLLRGYDPKTGPYIRVLDPKRHEKPVTLRERKEGTITFWLLRIGMDVCIVSYELVKLLVVSKQRKNVPKIRWIKAKG